MTDKELAARLTKLEEAVDVLTASVVQNGKAIRTNAHAIQNVITGCEYAVETDKELGKRIDRLVEDYSNLATRHAGMVAQLRDLRIKVTGQ